MTAAVDRPDRRHRRQSRASSPAISASTATATPKSTHAAGIGLKAKYTLIGEGARGSLAKQLIARFGLAANHDPQLYGLGIKEVWELPADRHEPGRVDHYLGFPLDDATSGGGFAYHAEDRKLYLGFVTHLELFRTPRSRPSASSSASRRTPRSPACSKARRRLSYGARALTSGGLQSIPDLAFPGGALIGCAAGFMNVPALKAIHSAIRSGIATADAVAAAIAAGRAHDTLDQPQ